MITAEPGSARRRVGLTVRGRCLLAGGAAMAVSAVVLDERDLVRIGLFVILLPLLSLAFAWRAERTLEVSRTLSPDRVPAGDTTTAGLRIAGGSLLGSLRIADTVPDAAGASDRYPPRFTVHRLGRRGARVAYPLRPQVRGDYRVGPLRGRATDPLGLAEFSRDLLEADRLLVLPRVVALTGRPVVASTAVGRAADGGSRQGAGRPDVLIRPYQQGDEMRRVHWRSSARRDELMVRLDERPDPTGVTVLLDRRDGAHRGHGAASSLEYAVSLAASVCVYLLGRREAVELITEDGAELVAAATGSAGTAEQIARYLDALAVLRPSAGGELAGSASTPAEAGVLAVLGAMSPDAVAGLVTAHPRGGHAVLLDAEGWAGRAGGGAASRAVEDSAARLRRAGWQATVVTADTPVEQAWAAVCGTTSFAGAGR